VTFATITQVPHVGIVMDTDHYTTVTGSWRELGKLTWGKEGPDLETIKTKT